MQKRVVEESQGDPINSSMQWPVEPTNLLQAAKGGTFTGPKSPEIYGSNQIHWRMAVCLRKWRKHGHS